MVFATDGRVSASLRLSVFGRCLDGSEMKDPNRENLRVVAEALGELREDVVFLGGAVVGLFITDNAAPRPRTTKDVDVTVDVAPLSAWQTKLVPRLRDLGFRETGDAICWWRVGGVLVDVMPADESVFGFSNPWYPEAIATAEDVMLADDVSIRVATPTIFLATKMEAFKGRGGGDFMSSHDVEDVIVVVDGRESITTEVGDAPARVREFVCGTTRDWLSETDFSYAIEGAVEQGREQIVTERLREIKDLIEP